MGTYYKKKKKNWYYQFFIQKNGIRKAYKGRGFQTKKDAEREERIRRIEIENEKENKNNDIMTIGDACNLFLEKMKNERKASTFKEKQTIVNKYILPHFKNLKTKDLTKQLIAAWKRDIVALNFSELRSNIIIAAFKKILELASEYGEIDYKVIKELSPIKRDKIKEQMNIWSLDQFNLFIESFDNDDRYKLFFTVLFYSGMRIAEIRALMKKDIKNNTIFVNKTISSKNDKVDGISTPKTRSSIRYISMPDWIMDAIKEKIKGLSPNDFIFATKNKPYSETDIRRHLNRHIITSNVPKIRIHDFRHSHASYLINSGIPIKAVSQRLGHSSVKTTMDVYWHLMDKDEDNILKLLNK